MEFLSGILQTIFSSWFTSTIAALAAYILARAIADYRKVPSHLKRLPGPWGLPIVGYIPFIGKYPWRTFTELGRRYGEIFTVSFGSGQIVILNSREVIMDAHVKDFSFAGRPENPTLKAFADLCSSRFFARKADEQWKFLRTAGKKALALVAASKSSRLETVVYEAFERFSTISVVTLLRSMEADLAIHEPEHPINPLNAIADLMCGVIGTINFGGQYDRHSPFIHKLATLAHSVHWVILWGTVADYLPFGSFLFQKRIKAALLAAEKPFLTLIEDHVENYQCNEVVTDLADALNQVADETSEEEMAKVSVSRAAIRYIAEDFFGAAVSTGGHSYHWLLNIMAVYQDAQAEVQSELAKVLGPNGLPKLADRERLPITEATIHESLRFASTISMLLPHATMTDTELKGYFVPKGAIVLTNLYGLHHNPELFPEPFEFRPHRFLRKTADQKIASGSSKYELNSLATQNTFPFGVGKRRCIGENLGRQQLFLLFALTMQRFSIRPAPGENIDLHSVMPGLTRRPLPFRLVFSPKQSISAT